MKDKGEGSGGSTLSIYENGKETYYEFRNTDEIGHIIKSTINRYGWGERHETFLYETDAQTGKNLKDEIRAIVDCEYKGGGKARRIYEAEEVKKILSETDGRFECQQTAAELKSLEKTGAR